MSKIEKSKKVLKNYCKKVSLTIMLTKLKNGGKCAYDKFFLTKKCPKKVGNVLAIFVNVFGIFWDYFEIF
jgi:hypothetical protein